MAIVLTKRKEQTRKPKAIPAATVSPPLRTLLGLRKKDFARLAGFSERAITDFENGKKVSEALSRKMQELTRLQSRLASVIQSEAIPFWLMKPNNAYDGLTPIEVVERGQIDRLWETIYFLESGTAS